MARFILKWRYFKSGSKSHTEHFVKYVATREGVEKCDESWKNEPATSEQQRLIGELLKEFPNSAESFEHQDYLSNPTKQNASEFITRIIEENLDLIGKKENYVGYIAMRPRVEKQGSHGLFSQTDEPIVLSEVAEEVANHDGTVWTNVLSLRREDAERLGFNNANAWKNMIRGQTENIAKAMNIPLKDLKWYAAFHNESHHPHVHLITYSTGKAPYMTERWLKTLKSNFARQIFKLDLYNIYESQTQKRDEVRDIARDRIKSIVDEINKSGEANETVMIMLKSLSKELNNYTGKKVYGYIPKKAKNLVNGIVDELAKDERIAELYELWYQDRDNIIGTYQDAKAERVPLSVNNEFKKIKNVVIAEAINILNNTVTFEDDFSYNDDSEPQEKPKKATTNMYSLYRRAKVLLDEESEEYNPDEAINLLKQSADMGYEYAIYRLGKIYLQGEVVEKDVLKALDYLYQACDMNNEFAEYLLGKTFLKGEDVPYDYREAEQMLKRASDKGNIYAKYSLAKMHLTGTAQICSIKEALRLLMESADRGNHWSMYQLGKMYLYGQGVPKDYDRAMEYLKTSAENGNTYAQRLIDNYNARGSGSGAFMASIRLLYRLSKIIRDDNDKRDKGSHGIDRKLLRKIEQKKLAHGLKMGG